jgi:hypothetical protein
MYEFFFEFNYVILNPLTMVSNTLIYDDRFDPNDLFIWLYFKQIYTYVILTINKSIPYVFKKYVNTKDYTNT